MPVLIYASLEILIEKIKEMETGRIGPGPGLRRIRRQMAETNTAMETIVMHTINRLYSGATSLAEAGTKEEEDIGRKEFLTDLIDSINEKTARLLLMRERMHKKMNKINTEHHTTASDTTGYGGKGIILLHSRTNKIIMYSTSLGQIIRPEYEEYTSPM